MIQCALTQHPQKQNSQKSLDALDRYKHRELNEINTEQETIVTSIVSLINLHLNFLESQRYWIDVPANKKIKLSIIVTSENKEHKYF